MTSVNLGEHEHIAKAQAKKKQGNNLSLYLQNLVKEDYERDLQQETTTNNNLKLFLSQLIIFSFTGMSLLFLGVTSMSGEFYLVSFLLLAISGVMLVIYSIMLYKYRGGIGLWI